MKIVWSEATIVAQKAAGEALEVYLRAAHGDRMKAGYFGDSTTWDEEETEAANIHHKVLTSWAVSSQFQSLSEQDSVNVLYGIPAGQSPVTTKGLFGYAYEAYR